MCGIFGSTDWERYNTLYQLNKDRGSFAYGGMYLYEGLEPIVQACEGDSFQFNGPDVDTGQYYMGHTQGPTSAKRDFDPKTSHPFRYHEWYVAHNGVLSNAVELAKKYKVDNPVDSAVIPAMIWDKYHSDYDPDIWKWVREQQAIIDTCNELKGTFACWIYNTDSKNTYIVRNGSTLFVNDRGEFSSTKEDGMTSLDEGGLYRIDHVTKEIVNRGKFDTSSPFFIL